MSSYAVFLDIDGTYLDSSRQVPPSAADAVRAARANGHQVFLCTGRSLAEIWPHFLEAGFDGVISSGGGHVGYGDEVLLHHTIPTEALEHARSFLEEGGFDYILESNTGLYPSRGVRRRMAEIVHPDLSAAELDDLAASDAVILKPLAETPDVLPPVNKIVVMGSDTPVDVIRAEFEGEFDVIAGTIPPYGPNMFELALPGIHKASAIAALLEHAGIDREHSIAFGDASNDLEMIEYVAIGVAMGDAQPEVIAVADLVTDSADEDGIARGFARLGLV